MFTITKLKMWKDPGYTRQCLEVPPVGSKKLPTPDYVSTEDLRPRRGSTLSAVELPLSYLEVFDMSYLYIEAEDGRTPSNKISVFGWILSIEETASGNEAVRITWTPDYWRTYSDKAIFGKSTIKRCSDATYKRPYPVSPRFWKVEHYEKLVSFNHESLPSPYDPTYPYWICISYNMTVGTKTVTTTIFWQCNETLGKTITNYDNMATYRTMSLKMVTAGLCEEYLNLKTGSINSIYISPVQPYNMTNSVNAGGLLSPNSYEGVDWSAYIKIEDSGSIGSLVIYANEYETNDFKKAVVVDPYGSIIAMIPWGMKINSGELGTDAGTTGCNIVGNFYHTREGTNTTMDNILEGRNICAPLINAPINSNAYGDYVLSGQLEYDRNLKQIQRDEQRLNGYASSASSAIGGAVAGGVATANPAGALAGALIGEVGSIVGTEIQYELSGKFNDAYQAITNKLYSNQASTLIQPAGGDSYLHPYLGLKDWYIVQLEGDTTSTEEYENDISMNGYEVDIPTDSTLTFISDGGPLQIQNLVITGPIPPEAKTNIKNILSNGVRIVENNPAGVDP